MAARGPEFGMQRRDFLKLSAGTAAAVAFTKLGLIPKPIVIRDIVWRSTAT
jgi:hypothetical protein